MQNFVSSSMRFSHFLGVYFKKRTYYSINFSILTKFVRTIIFFSPTNTTMFVPKYTKPLKSIDQTRETLNNKKIAFKIILIHNYNNDIANQILEYLEHKYEDIMDHIQLKNSIKKNSISTKHDNNHSIISLNSVDIEIGMYHQQSVAEYCGFCAQCHGDNLPMLQVFDVKGRKMRELFFDSSKIQSKEQIENELDLVFEGLMSSVKKESQVGQKQHHSHDDNHHHHSKHSLLSIPTSKFISNTTKKAHHVAHQITHCKISKSLEDFLKHRKSSRNKENSKSVKIQKKIFNSLTHINKRTH